MSQSTAGDGTIKHGPHRIDSTAEPVGGTTPSEPPTVDEVDKFLASWPDDKMKYIEMRGFARQLERELAQAEARCQDVLALKEQVHKQLEDKTSAYDGLVGIKDGAFKALAIWTERAEKAEREVAELRALLREAYGEFSKRHIRATDLQQRIDSALREPKND